MRSLGRWPQPPKPPVGFTRGGGGKYVRSMYRPVENGTLIRIQFDWWKSYAILPHKMISGKWIWGKTVYKRVVWRYTGFVDEPFTEYGTIFDVLNDIENPTVL